MKKILLLQSLLALLVLCGSSMSVHADKIEDDIKAVEKKIKDIEDKKKALSTELAAINGELSQQNTVIKTTEQKITEAEIEIDRKEAEIDTLTLKHDIHQKHLRTMLQQMSLQPGYDKRLLSLGDSLTALWQSNNEYSNISLDLQNTLVAIQNNKDEIDGTKKKLEEKKSEHAELLEEKKSERADTLEEKQETAEDLKKAEATIGELNSKLAKLKDSLNGVVDGGANAKDIEEAASRAAKATGIRKDFLMGQLVVESDLGRYTGGCTYAQVEDGAKDRYKKGKLSSKSWATFQRRRDIFVSIAKELDKDYRKLKVSCNPAGYTGTGGAMGVPQFMPDTWMGYKARIAKATGHNPPNPWSLTDGVMAMAIKLSVVPGVTSHSKAAERNASKLYLSGTTSASYNWYADKVQYWANNYERLIGK